MRRPMLFAAAVALLCAAGVRAPLAARPAVARPAALVPLSIATKHGERHFRVEVARTEQEQVRGLMFRTVVAQGSGMLFPFGEARTASFWMKNTLVPLDMLFIRADGTIARIAARTKPETFDLVSSGEPVIAVLELAGGVAAKQRIAAGDHVRWPGGPTG